MMSEQSAPVLDHLSVKEMPAFAEVMPRVAANRCRRNCVTLSAIASAATS
jgi:hypothetical protein